MEQKRERPILFYTPMVKALLEGRETQTRRIIKSRHESGLFQISRRMTDNQITSIESLDWDERNCEKDITCPYGKPGDILWVREKWSIVERAGQGIGNKFIVFEDEWENGQVIESAPLRMSNEGYKWGGHPSIHLKRKYARIFLEITDIKVERLQDISEEDAIAEGIQRDEIGYRDYDKELQKQYGHPDHDWPHWVSPIDSFKSLWQSINGPESWNENPWVWCLTFKILSHNRGE